MRQLIKRIEMPMEIYKTKPQVINHELMKNCIQKYNSLLGVLIHSEILYHRAWYDQSSERVSSYSST